MKQLKQFSIILLCLTLLVAMGACQTGAEDGATVDNIELTDIEEVKIQDSNAVNKEMQSRVDRSGPPSYYGVMDGHYLTNKKQVFTFGIKDHNSLNHGMASIKPFDDKDYVPALRLRAAISKGDTIYVMSFSGSNDHQALLEFAAEYIDANYDLEE